MTRTAAVISAALALSKDGMTNFLKVDKKDNDTQPISKWKMAGRYYQIARRPKR
jgi:hypothetical protein